METLDELAGFVHALRERFENRAATLPPAARRAQELGILLAIQARVIALYQRLEARESDDVGRRRTP